MSARKIEITSRAKKKIIDQTGNYIAIVALIKSCENKLLQFVFKSYNERIDR